MERTVEIHSVNISEKKGIIKTPVDSIHLTNIGIPQDAHRGSWHRQISMLGKESIDKFSGESSRKYSYGEFAENITSKGMEVYKTNIFDRFSNDQVELEVTQIGKKCHGAGCSIYKEVGNCVMPKEGIFLRVRKEGYLKPGDVLSYLPKSYKVKIITMSDRASQGIYEDRSGPKLVQATDDFFKKSNRISSIENDIIPDESHLLSEAITSAVDAGTDIIFTTGGTGIGPRDITPDTIGPMLDRGIPGIMELIRVKYGMEKPNALLSRGIAGVINKSLVYTLPGNPKAIHEYTTEIFKTMDHAMRMIHGISNH